MPPASIMIQGTGSNVGKSLIVAGLCRLFARQGIKAVPFKPQNMSNNAAVSIEGGEIGRAQALQAKAANLPASIHMNPILLKPQSNQHSQIIVQGKLFATCRARDYGNYKQLLLEKALESYDLLSQNADIMLIEGAGSPAEINLRDNDIANMGFAEQINAPVLLIGDIDRGGVIASLIGTHHILSDADKMRIKAFAINRFRGDQSLFRGASHSIAQATGWHDAGIIPWFDAANRFPAEDSQDLAQKYNAHKPYKRKHGQLHIVVPRLNSIANFDDLDPLAAETGVRLSLIDAGHALPLDADMILLPGSKNTISDLVHFKAQGWHHDLYALHRHGCFILGLCGGYQMLCTQIHDPEGIESSHKQIAGLGLLDCETTLTAPKITRAITARSPFTGDSVEGYEIHMGRTQGADCANPVLTHINGDQARIDGAIAPDGLVMGCYMHGLFHQDQFRHHFIAKLGGKTQDYSHEASLQAGLDELADHLETHLDIEKIKHISNDK
ncbi:MAG: cobyric acid synthase [Alphaproteobacteria bacterium]